MSDRRREIGAAGEAAAMDYLRRQGYRLLHRNLHLGRLGELDLVMLERGVLAFVEVKSKLQGDLGGFENITAAKQRKLVELATAYIQRYPGKYRGMRFDAVEVVYADLSLARPQITLLRDAFRA